MNSPELFVIAGPNGVGKTTFALEYAGRTGIAYLGADAFAEKLSPENPSKVRFSAGRQFLRAVDQHLSDSESLIVETTLSGRSFRHTIAKARQNDFRISIAYFFLETPETCISRIEQRVRKGGHHVPEQDVRRRFLRSATNFWAIYRELADDWVMMYNASGQLQDIAAGSHDHFAIRDKALFGSYMDLMEAPYHE